MTFPTTGIIDPFNRANEDPISDAGKWSSNPILTFDGGLKLVSNQAQGRLNVGSSWRNDATYLETEVYCTVATKPGSGGASPIALYARLQTPGTTGVDAYEMSCLPLPGTDTITLYRVIDKVWTQLTQFTHEFVTGNKIGMAVKGSGATVTIEAWIFELGAWAMVGSYADSNVARITSAGYIGCLVQDPSPSGGIIDDFGGGTIVATTPKSGADTGSGADASVQRASISIGDTAGLLTQGFGEDAFGVGPFGGGVTGEQFTLAAAYLLSDVGGSVENAAVVASSVSQSGSDNGAGVESISLKAALSISDAAAGIDTVALNFSSIVFDTGTSSDVASTTGKPSPVDTGTSFEQVAISALVSDVQFGVGADTQIVNTLYVGSEVGAGTDTSSFRVLLTGADAGVGDDQGTPTAQMTVSDFGQADEAGTAPDISFIEVFDSGSVIEAFSLLANVVAQETANAIENIAMQVQPQVSDTGQTDDTSSLASQFSGIENGIGSEAAVVTIRVTTNETGYGVESSILGVMVTANDDREGIDVAALISKLIVADQGAGIEDSQIALRVSDIGHAVEISDMVVVLSVSDQSTNVVEFGKSDKIIRIRFPGLSSGITIIGAKHPAPVLGEVE